MRKCYEFHTDTFSKNDASKCLSLESFVVVFFIAKSWTNALLGLLIAYLIMDLS